MATKLSPEEVQVQFPLAWAANQEIVAIDIEESCEELSESDYTFVWVLENDRLFLWAGDTVGGRGCWNLWDGSSFSESESPEGDF